jgi:hypothetical protein
MSPSTHGRGFDWITVAFVLLLLLLLLGLPLTIAL